MKNTLFIGLAVLMIVACGKKEEPKVLAPFFTPSTTSPPSPAIVTPKDAAPSFVPTPPAPPHAVYDGIQRPMPGQANDDSNPEFKAGGQTDPKK